MTSPFNSVINILCPNADKKIDVDKVNGTCVTAMVKYVLMTE